MGDSLSSTPRSCQVVREDVQAVWHELEEARNVLAEVQALRYEVPKPPSTKLTLGKGGSLWSSHGSVPEDELYSLVWGETIIFDKLY